MNKPDALKRLLLATVPQFTDAPERLSLFVDQGRVAARVGGSLSFEHRYKLNLVAQDFVGDASAIFVPILAWIAEAQPELLEKPDGEPFTFESEILDAETIDLSITIALTERVAVIPRAEGGFEVRALDEPGDGDRFDGICGVSLWQLFLRDQLVAQTSDPAP